jgi:hypothetical protein
VLLESSGAGIHTLSWKGKTMTTTYKYKIGEVLNWHCRPEKSSDIAHANVTIVEYARRSVIGKCLTYKVRLASGETYPDTVYETCLFPVEETELTHCTCSLPTLMVAGCRCGWIGKERKRDTVAR